MNVETTCGLRTHKVTADALQLSHVPMNVETNVTITSDARPTGDFN